MWPPGSTDSTTTALASLLGICYRSLAKEGAMRFSVGWVVVLGAAVIARSAAAAVPIAGHNFDGIGSGFQGFVPSMVAADPTGAAGDTQYVQAVNLSYAVFDKTTGARIAGPIAMHNLFAGFGGACAVDVYNTGDAFKHADPVVVYDHAADRWFLTYFAWDESFPDSSGLYFHYYQCIAISETSDATGAYYRYAFETPEMADTWGGPPHRSKNDYGK